jgi:hypothetical protein
MIILSEYFKIKFLLLIIITIIIGIIVSAPRSGGRSVGIVRSRTQTTEFVCFFIIVSGSTAYFGPGWRNSPTLGHYLRKGQHKK